MLIDSAESAGIVGFDTDMGATKLSQHADDTSSTIATVRAGMQEIEQRWGQPFRHSLWKYLLPVSNMLNLCSSGISWCSSSSHRLQKRAA